MALFGPSPLQRLWAQNFPFSYWDNRLEKISRYNREDRLDVVYAMLQLCDLYTHVFAARVRNMNEPWFILKEETYMSDIKGVLDALTEPDDEGREMVFVEKLAEESEETLSFEVKSEWDFDRRDWVAVKILGCPSTYNGEEMTVEYDEDPELHFRGASSILQFWRDNLELLNDFKHGFRVLPCNQTTFKDLAANNYLRDDEPLDKTVEVITDSANGRWELSFIRMDTTEQEDRFNVYLNVLQADLERCLALARLALHQLYNLFDYEVYYSVKDDIATLFAGTEGDGVSLLELVAQMELKEGMIKPEYVDEE